MRNINESGYTYLGIVKTDKIKEKKMRENSKRYSQRFRLSLKSKLHEKNKIMVIYTWVVLLASYGAGNGNGKPKRQRRANTENVKHHGNV